jgi:hypothetical protein
VKEGIKGTEKEGNKKMEEGRKQKKKREKERRKI